MGDGINIKGQSKINANQIVIGTNAKAIMRGKVDIVEKSVDITEQIDELNEMIIKYESHFEDTLELLEALSNIKTELKKETPNEEIISTRINKLASSVSSVTSMAKAVGALKAAILTLI
jgi:hypothetical protein